MHSPIEWDDPSEQELSQIERHEFCPGDFELPVGEQLITIHLAPLDAFASLIRFWCVSACAAIDYQREYRTWITDVRGQHLSDAEMREKVEDYSSSLLKPLPAVIGSSIKDGYAMHLDWNDVALVWRTDSYYVAFYWSTTACALLLSR